MNTNPLQWNTNLKSIIIIDSFSNSFNTTCGFELKVHKNFSDFREKWIKIKVRYGLNYLQHLSNIDLCETLRLDKHF